MTHTTHYWLQLSLCLVGGLGLLSAIILIVRKGRKLNVSWTKDLKLSSEQSGLSTKRIITSKILEHTSKLLLVVVGTIIGSGWTEYRANVNRYHYTNVLVVKRFDTQNFLLQPARMQPFKAKTCEKGLDWQVGQKMEFLYFQWTPECDYVGERGAFKFYEQDGKRMQFKTQEIADAR